MKKFKTVWREKRRLVYLALFLVMIFPALFSFYAAEAENSPLMILLLGLVILANIGTLFE
jgi:hypothetical protein